MNYTKLFQTSRVVKVGLIGTGAFGNSFLFQTRSISPVDMVVVCDREISIAWQACLRAGIAEAQLAACSSAGEAQRALTGGQIVVLEDALLMMDLPIDVVVEATGMPEAGASYSQAAIDHGKHVVMVSKETDSVVGPILTRLAAERGLVYTPADGDQPSLLIGLMTWAEMLGLEMVCAGKSSERDFVYNLAHKSVSNGRQTVQLSGDGPWNLWDIPPHRVRDVVLQRSQILKDIPQVAVPDLCEMAIVINSTNLGYDAPQLCAPIVRITELPEVLRGRETGGILGAEGVIDMVNCLRRTDEVSFAGGVFVVVACEDKATWELLKNKGHVVSRDGSRAAIFRPYHLLGVETATTILSAAILNQPTGGVEVRPRVDLGARAKESLKAGQQLTMTQTHAIIGVAPEIMPATPIRPNSPIPFYLAANNTLKSDVSAGTQLTYGMVERDPHSTLWQLKRLQDKIFLENDS